MEPGGERPTNEIDLEHFLEVAPEDLIDVAPENRIELVPENPIEDLREAAQTPQLDALPVLADMSNVLTPEEEETNVTITHAEGEKKPSTPQHADDEGPPIMTLGERFTPVDVVNVEHVQQVVARTPRYAASFTLDAEFNSEDPMQTWPYAMDVFNYQKEREKVFVVKDYMPHQTYLTPWKRRLLVSWLVTAHLTFGTFRETFYLSVKIFDLYLSRFVVAEDMLQLLAAAAIRIASKYEEREVLKSEPLTSLCHWDYTASDLLRMEQETLCGLDFDLGIPIGYRFLRRYARSAHVPEPTWTLASYILELNLMEYNNVGFIDSKLAAAALFMALRMCGEASQLDAHTWSPTLVHYSGYQLPEFAGLVPVLNAVLHGGSHCYTVKIVRSLYSSPQLYDVASVPHLTTEELFLHNPEQLE